MPEKIADQIYCDWKMTAKGWDSNTWNTACGNKFYFLGNFKDNDYNFCPGCGRHIREVI